MKNAVILPAFVHRLLRRFLPLIVRCKGGWRVQQWALDVDRSRFRQNTVLTPLETGGRMWVDPNDSMARYIFYCGLWEPMFARHFAAEVREGDSVLDVGANVGQYSVIAARRVGAQGRVISVEINPDCLAVLARNVRLCQPVSMDVLNVAAWSEDTEMSIVQQDSHVTGLTSVRECEEADVEDSRVPARRLDDALDDLGCSHVDVVKLDIEGAELPALRGMSRMLETSPPRVIYCEIEHEHCVEFGYGFEDVFSYLGTFGYQAFGFRRSDGSLTPRRDDCADGEFLNMFCFRLP